MLKFDGDRNGECKGPFTLTVNVTVKACLQVMAPCPSKNFIPWKLCVVLLVVKRAEWVVNPICPSKSVTIGTMLNFDSDGNADGHGESVMVRDKRSHN